MNVGLVVLIAGLAVVPIACAYMHANTTTRGCKRGCADCPNQKSCHRTRWRMTE